MVSAHLLVAQVKLAQRATDGNLFAIKCLNRSRLVNASQSGRLAREIRLLKVLNHPNVIRLHEVLHTPSEILMVMEYVDGGDLLEVLNTRKRFTEAEVRHIFCQICSGVSFCHSLGVAHRDLKPENVLIGKRTPEGHYPIKVADFGLSTLMRADEMLSTACGSPHYVAPEILTFDGGVRLPHVAQPRPAFRPWHRPPPHATPHTPTTLTRPPPPLSSPRACACRRPTMACSPTCGPSE